MASPEALNLEALLRQPPGDLGAFGETLSISGVESVKREVSFEVARVWSALALAALLALLASSGALETSAFVALALALAVLVWLAKIVAALQASTPSALDSRFLHSAPQRVSLAALRALIQAYRRFVGRLIAAYLAFVLSLTTPWLLLYGREQQLATFADVGPPLTAAAFLVFVTFAAQATRAARRLHRTTTASL